MTEREKLERKYSDSLTRLVGGASYIVYTDENKPAAMMFRPKSKKPWRRLKFENVAQREDVVMKFAKDVVAEFEAKRGRRDDRKSAVTEFRDSVNVGDLFAYEWGTVDRHVWFYILVEKLPDKARLMHIGARRVLSATGELMAVPDTDVCHQEGEIVKKYGPGHFEMPDDKILKKTTRTKMYFVSR